MSAYDMESRVKGCVFRGQVVVPDPPMSNASMKINHDALLALPFIGLWVGVDNIFPTKSVYAIYDASNDGIRYVHGDGTLIVPEQVCFGSLFKDSRAFRNQTQQLSAAFLKNASSKYYKEIHSENSQLAGKWLGQFPSAMTITNAFLYNFDSSKQRDTCPALSAPNFDYTSDATAPTVEVFAEPKWDFSPNGFQAYASQSMVEHFKLLFSEFQKKYDTSLDAMDFQHATFCLAGLVKANLVSFVYEGQNDARSYIAGQTQILPPQSKLPPRTMKGWTVDCFLARFAIWQDFYQPKSFNSYPNPIQWLEASMDAEEMVSKRAARFTKTNPWKGRINDVPTEAILDWESLKQLRWQTRGDSNRYPKVYQRKTIKAPELDMQSQVSTGDRSFNADEQRQSGSDPQTVSGNRSSQAKSRSDASRSRSSKGKEKEDFDPLESKTDRRLRVAMQKLQKRNEMTKNDEYYGQTKMQAKNKPVMHSGLHGQGARAESQSYGSMVFDPFVGRRDTSAGVQPSAYAGIAGFTPVNRAMQDSDDSPLRNKRKFASNDGGDGIQQSGTTLQSDKPGHSSKKHRSRREPSGRSSITRQPTINDLFASPGREVQRRRHSELRALRAESSIGDGDDNDSEPELFVSQYSDDERPRRRHKSARNTAVPEDQTDEHRSVNRSVDLTGQTPEPGMSYSQPISSVQKPEGRARAADNPNANRMPRLRSASFLPESSMARLPSPFSVLPGQQAENVAPGIDQDAEVLSSVEDALNSRVAARPSVVTSASAELTPSEEEEDYDYGYDYQETVAALRSSRRQAETSVEGQYSLHSSERHEQIGSMEQPALQSSVQGAETSRDESENMEVSLSAAGEKDDPTNPDPETASEQTTEVNTENGDDKAASAESTESEEE